MGKIFFGDFHSISLSVLVKVTKFFLKTGNSGLTRSARSAAEVFDRLSFLLLPHLKKNGAVV